ncbi:hypothetical protein pmac_cds_798 [Pandoravirus macleodensis]|uniref:Uncharacterized protein n=1 Tax=Pandoravirus macleodensis TaxID=2107707 RepID=A0A2U7UG89_9VIRU|nr:hypothetical protein pmac_cds_798 [Pandoravirus macleodensis]AVK77486.1 hypothetical protein pmac_cds_798 [Pandoravirus macleodensis]
MNRSGGHARRRSNPRGTPATKRVVGDLLQEGPKRGLVIVRQVDATDQFLCVKVRKRNRAFVVDGGALNVIQLQSAALPNYSGSNGDLATQSAHGIRDAMSKDLREVREGGVGGVWIVSDAQYSDGSRSGDQGNPEDSQWRRIVQVTAKDKSGKALFVSVTLEGRRKDPNWLIGLPAPSSYDPDSEDAPIMRADGSIQPLSGDINCSYIEARPPPTSIFSYFILDDTIMEQARCKIVELYGLV